MNNYDVIREFWQENDLMNSNSVIRFNCIYTINLININKVSSTQNTAMIWLDAGSISKVQIMDFAGNPRDFPTDFWLDYGVMSYEGNILTIEGKHPTLGNYIATIVSGDKVA